jgi:CheY-like chemotaxis protein
MGRGGHYSIDSLSGFYALVVDGDKERRTLVAGVLRYCGALVTPVETPLEALAVMQLLKPDVLVVDVARPEDTGFDFIRTVRALKPEDGGVVAAVALVDDTASGPLARSRGYDAHLTKPLDPWELCRTVSTLLST